MEESNEVERNVLNILFDEQKIFEYFDEFRRSVEESKYPLNYHCITKFFKCLQHLEKINFFYTCTYTGTRNEFDDIFLAIFNCVCNKYLNSVLCNLYKESPNECVVLFDVIALLVKFLASRSDLKIVLQPLISHLKIYFCKYAADCETFLNEESENEELYHEILKLFVNVLNSLHSDNSLNCITEDIFNIILNSIPLSDKYAINIFCNLILPFVDILLEESRKRFLLNLMWKRIVLCYETTLDKEEKNFPYSFFSCLADYIFNENYEPYDFHVHDSVIFWKIIQDGLTSNVSYCRKQIIYILKILFFWLKNKNYFYTVFCEEISLFSVTNSKDLLIWNDFTVLFETLEEKQVHVIKPVLPKFSRILQYASEHYAPAAENSCSLHPSWITCFIKRMMMHESKLINKQGLSMALNINFNDWRLHRLHTEPFTLITYIQSFIQVVIEAVNDQNMFSRINENDNSSLFLSSEKLLAFINSYISSFETPEQKVDFLRFLLKIIASQSWCGVALLHLTFALSKLNSLSAWQSDDISHIRKIINGSLKSQEAVFRNAVEYWLLQACILLFDWNGMSFDDLMELLFIFKTLDRNTIIWNGTISKLKSVFSNEVSNNLSGQEAKAFCVSCIEKIVSSGNESLKETDLQKIAKLFMILADSSVISPEVQGKTLNWLFLLQPLISVLKDAPNRPYMSLRKFLNALNFYTLLIKESHGHNGNTNYVHCIAITSCLNCSEELIEFVYQKSFMDLKTGDHVYQFYILCNALTIFSSVDAFRDLLLKLLPGLIMRYNSIPENFLCKKVLMIIFFSILNFPVSDTEQNQKCHSSAFNKICFFLSSVIDYSIISDLSKSVFHSKLEKEAWLKLATKSICNFWNVTASMIAYLPYSELKEMIPTVVQLIHNALDGGPTPTLVSVIRCIKQLIPKLEPEKTSIMKSLLTSAWKVCFELHGNETFRSNLHALAQAVFQPCMLYEKYFDILYQYIDSFQELSENALGIYYFVINHFCSVFSLESLTKVNFNCFPFLIHAVTYGPIRHKGQRILEDTVAYISELDESFSFENYNKSSALVRVVVTTFLMKNLYKGNPNDEEITLKFISGLLELDKTTRLSNSSRFANSYNHRVRNRIWQIILLLKPNLKSKEENGKFFKTILNSLESENQQPSIRYLQEWLVLKILWDYECFIPDFISVLEKSEEKRPGFLTSLLSILTHLILHNFLISEDITDKCFPILIKYSMAQNFAVRLYSRLALTKLFAFCERQKFSSIIQKYDFLHKIVQSQQPENASLGKGNIYRNLLKLSEDFYFSVFHPVHHFTLETIFFELPRLSNMTSEEWIKPLLFKNQLESLSDFPVPCLNTDDRLKNSSISSWSEKSSEESTIEGESFDYNFQKKISPSKNEYIFYDSENQFGTKSQSKKNDLIVIASLIDRIPNLGGLCRTCEVFGVSELVISSLKYTEDKQFQNLAVSADKWVTIKEIKPYHLKEYLLSLKGGGYTIVGAEQTDNSYRLSDYMFPKKSALLLGHEKEGMPVELIQLLDACVEIPQQGIIRSLNVHVSGAIFIWEYARQQMKQVQ